jgi:TonB family protein
MRTALLALLLAGLSCPQSADDARKLIEDVAATASDATGWHIEGSMESVIWRSAHPARSGFTFWQRSKDQGRYEQTGDRPLTIVCDGAVAWTYSSPLHRYRKESPVEQLCSQVVAEWTKLPERLESPQLVGGCGPDPSIDTPADYKLVRAYIDSKSSSADRTTREFCINPERKLIAWEKWDTRQTSVLRVYSLIERQPKFAEGIFTFAPPASSSIADFELPGADSMVRNRNKDITPPGLVSKQAPKYGKQSRKNKTEGTVVLYVIVSPEGMPAEVFVYGPLAPDLDEEAIKAVKQWRFSPAMRDGKPIEFPATIEINFKLR